MATQNEILRGPHRWKDGVYYPVANPTYPDYPKWVGDKIVNSKEEEEALQPKAKESKKPEYKDASK
jgi:hypothetical protein